MKNKLKLIYSLVTTIALLASFNNCAKKMEAVDEVRVIDLSSLSLLTSEFSLNENGGKQLLTINLNSSLSGDMDLEWNLDQGEFGNSADFRAHSGLIKGKSGMLQIQLELEPSADNIFEGVEEFNLSINKLGDQSKKLFGLIRVNDGSELPSLSLAGGITREGESLVLKAELSTPSSLPVSFTYRTRNLSALAGSDYAALDGTMSFAPGETSKNISLQALPDAVGEANENVAIDITSIVNTKNNANQMASVTIVDINGAPTLSVANVMAKEEDKKAVVTVTLSHASSTGSVVIFQSADLDAKSASDYVASQGQVVFNAGEISKTIEVSINDDVVDEDDQKFRMMYSAVGVQVGTPSSDVTILDNDKAPLLSVAVKTQGSEKSAKIDFVFSIDIASERLIKFDYATQDGTAVMVADYTETKGTAMILPGELRAMVTVPLVMDAVAEQPEQMTLMVNNFVNLSNVDAIMALGEIVELVDLNLSFEDAVGALPNGTYVTLSNPVTINGVVFRSLENQSPINVGGSYPSYPFATDWLYNYIGGVGLSITFPNNVVNIEFDTGTYISSVSARYQIVANNSVVGTFNVSGSLSRVSLVLPAPSSMIIIRFDAKGGGYANGVGIDNLKVQMQ